MREEKVRQEKCNQKIFQRKKLKLRSSIEVGEEVLGLASWQKKQDFNRFLHGFSAKNSKMKKKKKIKIKKKKKKIKKKKKKLTHIKKIIQVQKKKTPRLKEETGLSQKKQTKKKKSRAKKPKIIQIKKISFYSFNMQKKFTISKLIQMMMETLNWILKNKMLLIKKVSG